MNESTDNLDFEQGLALLHQQASYSNGTFDRHLPTQWRRVLRSRLRKIQELLTATDVLLFRVSCRQDTDQFVQLLGKATGQQKTKHAGDCQRFAFRLLPADIQNSLKSDAAVKLSSSSGGGGRLLKYLQCDVEGDETFVIPLFRRDEKLTGLMVVVSSGDCEANLSPSQKYRLTEQLRQNGLLLLTNVQRQRKMARQEREVDQWRRIADNACDFAMQVNGPLLITQVVPFGYGEQYPPVQGLRLTDIVDRTFHRRMKQQIALALKDGKVRTIEFRLTLGAEPSSWYHVRIEPLANSTDGDCMMYLTNNTQDKGLQSEINRLNEQLVRASRLGLLGQMSTEFAHQLNQPLQAILGFADLTLRRMDRGIDTPEKTQTALKQIETSVTHAGNIIDSIREFARHRSLKNRPVSLSQILEDAIMMVTDRAHQLDGEFVVNGLQKEHEVMADRTQSTHVFINLFVNALEAASEFGVDPPLVNVRIEDPDDTGRIIVAVKDNGPGLPTVNPDQVFEKFHTQKEDGLGLGLTISRDVCEAQHGSLHAANNAHESGCTFYVAFRTAEADLDHSSLEGETAVD